MKLDLKFPEIMDALAYAPIYEKRGADAGWTTSTYCRAIRNPWGCRADCMIVDGCDEFGYGNSEPFLIDGQSFAEAFRKVL